MKDLPKKHIVFMTYAAVHVLHSISVVKCSLIKGTTVEPHVGWCLQCFNCFSTCPLRASFPSSPSSLMLPVPWCHHLVVFHMVTGHYITTEAVTWTSVKSIILHFCCDTLNRKYRKEFCIPCAEEEHEWWGRGGVFV